MLRATTRREQDCEEMGAVRMPNRKLKSPDGNLGDRSSRPVNASARRAQRLATKMRWPLEDPMQDLARILEERGELYVLALARVRVWWRH